MLALSSAHLIVTVAVTRRSGLSTARTSPNPLSEASNTSATATQGPDPIPEPGAIGPIATSSMQPNGRSFRRYGQIWQGVISLLTVRESQAEEAPQASLSPLGHAVLTGSIFAVAAICFAANMALTEQKMHRWDLCIHSEGAMTRPSTPSSGNSAWNESNNAINQAIANLKIATQSQRDRLLEQRHEILGIMNSYCMISHNFQIQFTSFTFVGTAAAILVSISLASVAPDGLKAKNRTLLNVLMTASIILAICVIYPQTFDMTANQEQAHATYINAANLMRSFNSTLANQQMATSSQNPAASTPLNSPEQVATYIRSTDNSLVQLTSAKISFNNDFANRTFSQIDGPGGGVPASNAGSGNPSAPTSAPATAP